MFQPSDLQQNMERRLLRLEQQLGIDNGAGIAGPVGSEKNNSMKKGYHRSMIDRLQTLEEQLIRKHGDFRSTCLEIDDLFQQLSPGTALSHQQQHTAPNQHISASRAAGSSTSMVAPLLYRRQEILAGADSMQKSLLYLQEVASLLSIGATGPVMHAKGQMWTESQVCQASILHPAIVSNEQEQQMQTVLANLKQVKSSLDESAARLDHLLSHYPSILLAMSEKMVLIEEGRQFPPPGKADEA